MGNYCRVSMLINALTYSVTDILVKSFVTKKMHDFIFLQASYAYGATPGASPLEGLSKNLHWNKDYRPMDVVVCTASEVRQRGVLLYHALNTCMV